MSRFAENAGVVNKEGVEKGCVHSQALDWQIL
jgi:hypothetical protein